MQEEWVKVESEYVEEKKDDHDSEQEELLRKLHSHPRTLYQRLKDELGKDINGQPFCILWQLKKFNYEFGEQCREAVQRKEADKE